MPLDYEQLRRNRQAEAAPSMTEWDRQTAAQVERDRQAYAKSREEEQLRRDMEAYGKFAARMAETERNRGRADRAADWEKARENIGKGLWSVGRTI